MSMIDPVVSFEERLIQKLKVSQYCLRDTRPNHMIVVLSVVLILLVLNFHRDKMRAPGISKKIKTTFQSTKWPWANSKS
jgi:hypothetical protein